MNMHLPMHIDLAAAGQSILRGAALSVAAKQNKYHTG